MSDEINCVGDSMAVRETMIKCLQILSKKFACRTDTFTIFENHDIDEVIHLMNDALELPPRNCDIKSIADDPHRAWLDDEENWDDYGSPYLEKADWLLATAREGGKNNS